MQGQLLAEVRLCHLGQSSNFPQWLTIVLIDYNSPNSNCFEKGLRIFFLSRVRLEKLNVKNGQNERPSTLRETGALEG